MKRQVDQQHGAIDKKRKHLRETSAFPFTIPTVWSNQTLRLIL